MEDEVEEKNKKEKEKRKEKVKEEVGVRIGVRLLDTEHNTTTFSKRCTIQPLLADSELYYNAGAASAQRNKWKNIKKQVSLK